MRKTVSGFFKIEPERVTFSPVRFPEDRLPSTKPSLEDLLPKVEEEEKEPCLNP